MSKKTKGGAAAPFAPPLDPRLSCGYGIRVRIAISSNAQHTFKGMLHIKIKGSPKYYCSIAFF